MTAMSRPLQPAWRADANQLPHEQSEIEMVRRRLWQHQPEKLSERKRVGRPPRDDAETRKHFENPAKCPIILVAEADRRLAGFLELDFRNYAPGCRSSPVPFIEGWYVEPERQRQGIGRALIEAAEECARAAGHHEIASDGEVENADGIAADLALGYEEVERVVCFRRSLPNT
jgi:aminoglycoside 6'-N-acetyltransferase I